MTTNFMGLYRPIDYHRWAPHLDFASWDNYPPDDRSQARTALAHDLMRGLKDGAPFWLMEQTPTVTACRDVNPREAPRRDAAVAAGRRSRTARTRCCSSRCAPSRGASEKYHGAVHRPRRPHRHPQLPGGRGARAPSSTGSATPCSAPARRRGRPCCSTGTAGGPSEISDGPNRHVTYPEVVTAYYRALWQAGVAVDVVPVTADLTGYDVVVAPLLHMLKGDIADRLAAVLARGGSVLTTFLSGRVDEDDNAFLTDVPGPLAPLFGVRVDETDAQAPEVANPVHLAHPDADGPDGTVSQGRLVFELLVREGADVVGTYGTDFYAGTPAVTRHRAGAGEAWYVGTALDDAGVAWIVRQVIARHGLAGPYADVEDLELAVRERDGVRTGFLLHHGEKPLDIPAWAAGTELLTGRRVAAGEPLHVEPTDVLVLREDPS